MQAQFYETVWSSTLISQSVCPRPNFEVRQEKYSSLVSPLSVTEEKKFCGFETRGQCYKTRYVCKLRILVISQSVCPWQPFQTSLLFVGKARSLSQSVTYERFLNRVGSCFTNKHYTRREKLARDKHPSLLRKFVNYGRKSFIILF